MDSLPEQRIEDLPGATRQEAYLKIEALCELRRHRTYKENDIALKAGFGTAEAMHHQLKTWGLTGLLPPEKQEVVPKKRAADTKPERKVRNLGPAKELPPAGNATPLFKERLEALLESAELLNHINENLYGRYFGHTNVETADVRRADGTWETNALVRLPGRIELSPTEIEVTLIGVYALAGGRMDLLLEKLHLDPSSVDAKTWEEIRQCIEGSRPDDNKDGLKVLARQLATWVRGSEVRPGRRPGRSETDHAVASITTKCRKAGLTDEEITRKVAHLKKEDGTSYTVKDVTELGDLGLIWS